MNTPSPRMPDPERAGRRVADGLRFLAIVVVFGSLSIALWLDTAWSGFQPAPAAQSAVSGASGSAYEPEYGLATILMTMFAVLWAASLVLVALIGLVVGLPLRASRWGRRVQARLLPVTVIMIVVGLGLATYASARSHDLVTGAVGAGLLIVGLANLHMAVPTLQATSPRPGDVFAAEPPSPKPGPARWRMPGAIATLSIAGGACVLLFAVLVLGWVGATGFAPEPTIYPFLVAGLLITVTAAVLVGLPIRVEPGIRHWWTSRPAAAPITAGIGLLLIGVGVGAHVIDQGSTPLAIPIVVGWTVLAIGLANTTVPSSWTASRRPRPARRPRRPRRIAPGAAALIDG